MSVKICEEINKWVPTRVKLNVMGGEFTILDDYPDMLIALAKTRKDIRLVTNGLWSRTNSRAEKFLDTLKQLVATCSCVDVAISNDDWHTLSSDHAIELLEDCRNEIRINRIAVPNLAITDITPVGRAWDNHLIPKPHTHASCQVMSNMIIIENGMICKCPFGYFPWKHFSETTWYDAQDYVWGWRSEKLADGMNCHACMERVGADQRRCAECVVSN